VNLVVNDCNSTDVRQQHLLLSDGPKPQMELIIENQVLLQPLSTCYIVNTSARYILL
jgi:hypothetical protein